MGDFVDLSGFDVSDTDFAIPRAARPPLSAALHDISDNSVVYNQRARLHPSNLDDFSVELGRSKPHPSPRGARDNYDSSSRNGSPVFKVTSKHNSPTFKENIGTSTKLAKKNVDSFLPTEYRDDDSFFGKNREGRKRTEFVIPPEYRNHKPASSQPDNEQPKDIRNELAELLDVSGMSSFLSSEETSLLRKNRRRKVSHKPVASVPIDLTDQALYSAFDSFKAQIEALENDKAQLAQRINSQRDKMEQMSRSYDQLLERYDGLEEKRKKYKDAVIYLQNIKSTSSQEAESVVRERDEALESIRKKDSRIIELEQLLEASKKEIEAAIKERDEALDLVKTKNLFLAQPNPTDDNKQTGTERDEALNLVKTKEMRITQLEQELAAAKTLSDRLLDRLESKTQSPEQLSEMQDAPLKESEASKGSMPSVSTSEESTPSMRPTNEMPLSHFYNLLAEVLAQLKRLESGGEALPTSKPKNELAKEPSETKGSQSQGKQPEDIANFVSSIAAQLTQFAQRCSAGYAEHNRAQDGDVDGTRLDSESPSVQRNVQNPQTVPSKTSQGPKQRHQQPSIDPCLPYIDKPKATITPTLACPGQRVFKPIVDRLESNKRTSDTNRDDGNETVRPSMPSKEASGLLNEGLTKELNKLREKYNEKSEQYQSMDPAVHKHQREQLAREVQELVELMEIKANQIYAVYDLIVDNDILVDNPPRPVSEEYQPGQIYRNKWVEIDQLFYD